MVVKEGLLVAVWFNVLDNCLFLQFFHAIFVVEGNPIFAFLFPCSWVLMLFRRFLGLLLLSVVFGIFYVQVWLVCGFSKPGRAFSLITNVLSMCFPFKFQFIPLFLQFTNISSLFL